MEVTRTSHNIQKQRKMQWKVKTNKSSVGHDFQTVIFDEIL